MAKGMRDIKRQIKSVQNTKQITKAMEMVAAAKLRRAQESAQAARPYADKMKEVVTAIASGSKNSKNALLIERPIRKTAYLVMSSDRGLAGAFNANVTRRTMQLIKERHNSNTDEFVIYVIGRKGRDYFRKRNLPILEEVTGIADSPKFADIKNIAHHAVEYFIEEQYDELILIYNEFVNALTQRAAEKRILPMSAPQATGKSTQYEYEPSPEDVLDVLLPKYAETQIFSALLESKASEFGSRMTAMGNATKNATKMISSLTLTYNRARQAAITQEISEIVAGANAQN